MGYRRKSDEEIVQLKKEMMNNVLFPIEPLLYGIIIIPITFVLICFFPSIYAGGNARGPSLKILFISITTGLGIAIILYIIQLARRRKISDESYFGICNKCLSTNHTGKSKCKCGGKIEPHEFFNEIK